MMLLAQLSSDMMPPLLQWIVGLSAALFFANQVLTFWKEHMRERPTPADTYATKAEHEALAAAMDERFDKLNQDRRDNVTKLHAKIDAMRLEVEGKVGGVHDRITTLLASFSELKGAVSAALKHSNSPFNNR